MNSFPLTFRLIFTVFFLLSCVNLSDGLTWILQPSHKTLGHVGSTVHITWHYDCSQTFAWSTLIYGNRLIAQRLPATHKYIPIKNDMDAHFSVIGGSNVTIIISDVDKDKSGPYCCEVTCIGEPSETSCTMLFIYALPRINYLTSHLYGKQGDSITLRCNASGHPAPHISWIHKDTHRKIANSSVTSFNITGKASGGKYCCHVSNDFGEETNCTSLEIIALPPIFYLTSNLYGKQGDSITLRCIASGDPAPRVTWIHKDTNTIIANSSVTSFNITGKASGGKYCCHVSNGLWEETNCTSLEMTEYQPINTVLKSNKTFTSANETLKIFCKADASPPANYSIEQGNKKMVNSTDGYVTITAPENGYLDFSCIAKNKYGQGKTVHLKIPIYHKPVIDNRLSSGNNVSSILDDTIHLRCAARGVPLPNITWYTADGKIFSTGKTSYPGGSELVLTTTRKQDYGMYRCRAENTVGVAWHNITVMQICQCRGNYQKYKRSLVSSSSIIKESVIFIIWLSVTLVSGIVNIVLIIFIKSRKHQKCKANCDAIHEKKSISSSI